MSDGRWSCGKCGRFLPEAAVTVEDHIDPGAYYGVSTTITAECAKCGPIAGLDVRMTVWGLDDDATAVVLVGHCGQHQEQP